jgi:membrane-associated phospholipid phosphatase
LARKEQPVIISDHPVIAPTTSPLPPDDPWTRPLPRSRYFGPFALQYLLWLGLYLGVNAITTGRSALQPLLPGERNIPLVTWAYPFYGSVYLEVLLPLFLCRTRASFARVQLAAAFASLIAFAVFLLAPMPYPRPSALPDGVWSPLLSLEWSIDEPRCTFPSLHVAFGWLMYLGLRDEVPRWRPALLFLATAISVSTVLVKQHFIVDVAGGAALAWGSWALAGRWWRKIFAPRGGPVRA